MGLWPMTVFMSRRLAECRPGAFSRPGSRAGGTPPGRICSAHPRSTRRLAVDRSPSTLAGTASSPRAAASCRHRMPSRPASDSGRGHDPLVVRGSMDTVIPSSRHGTAEPATAPGAGSTTPPDGSAGTSATVSRASAGRCPSPLRLAERALHRSASSVTLRPLPAPSSPGRPADRAPTAPATSTTRAARQPDAATPHGAVSASLGTAAAVSRRQAGQEGPERHMPGRGPHGVHRLGGRTAPPTSQEPLAGAEQLKRRRCPVLFEADYLSTGHAKIYAG